MFPFFIFLYFCNLILYSKRAFEKRRNNALRVFNIETFINKIECYLNCSPYSQFLTSASAPKFFGKKTSPSLSTIMARRWSKTPGEFPLTGVNHRSTSPTSPRQSNPKQSCLLRATKPARLQSSNKTSKTTWPVSTRSSKTTSTKM